MPAILKSRSWLDSQTILIYEGSVVVFAHDFGQDRIRRIRLDQMESAAVLRRFPWLTILFVALVNGAVSAGLLSGDPTARTVFLCAAALVFLVFLAVAFFQRRYTLCLRRAGKDYRLEGTFWRRRFNRFIRELTTAVADAQRKATGVEPSASESNDAATPEDRLPNGSADSRPAPQSAAGPMPGNGPADAAVPAVSVGAQPSAIL